MTNRSGQKSARPAIQVTVRRGTMVESVHQVNAAVMDAAGTLLHRWGDIEKPVYLRSAIKPIQALPFVESGAADACNATDREISLACASHTGEDIHVDAVTAWLDRLGLGIEDLECGAHWPSYRPAERALAARGEQPTAAHNNCSGKHTGFLATARHLGEPLQGYIHLDHPVQQRIVRVLEDFTGLDLSRAPIGIDGCSIPTLGVPLDRAALAIARFADPSALGAERAAACHRIQQAIACEPMMIAGSDRLCTALNGSARGAVIAKVGAEGVYLAALPKLGLGISMKTVDGTTRGCEAALGAVLETLGVMTDEMHTAMDGFTRPVLKNWNGFEVGQIEAHLDAAQPEG